MADKEFKVLEYINGYPSQAMRRAVYGSLLSPKQVQTFTLEQQGAILRKKWHARIVSLRKAGWPGAEDATDLQYLRNCPPFGVKTADRSRPCRRKFCPFCWAREVVSPAYDSLLTAIRVDGLIRPGKMLIYFRQDSDFDFGDDSPAWDQVVDTIRAKRKSELDAFQAVNPLGAYVLQQIVIHDDALSLRRTGLIFADRNPQYLTAELVKSGTLRWKGIAVRKTEDLVAPLASVCRYPASLMQCSPGRLMDFLDATRNVRLASWYGCLRESKCQI